MLVYNAVYLHYAEATFFVGLLIFWASVWLLHLLAIGYARYRLHNISTTTMITTPPLDDVLALGVSVIKPLKDADEFLHANLTSFFRHDYPRDRFEVLLCVESTEDAAYAVAMRVLGENPEVDARILVGLDVVGVNPKINNVYKGFVAAKFDHVLISDSGIRMQPDTLHEMTSHIIASGGGDKVGASATSGTGTGTTGTTVGLVHQMPFVAPQDHSFCGALQTVYFGMWHAKMYLTAAAVGINCTTGMSCLMRRREIEAVGGLAVFGAYLAEDYFISQLFHSKMKVVVSSQLAWQYSASTVGGFLGRVSRWFRLRIAMLPNTIVTEPLSDCLPLGALAAWAAAHLAPTHINSVAFFLCHVLVWFLLDYCLLASIQPPRTRRHHCPVITVNDTISPSRRNCDGTNPTAITNSGPVNNDVMGSEPPASAPTFTKFELAAAWLFRELVCIPIQIYCHLHPAIEWRQQYFRLRWGGRVEAIPAKLTAAAATTAVGGKPSVDLNAADNNDNNNARLTHIVVVKEPTTSPTTTDAQRERYNARLSSAANVSSLLVSSSSTSKQSERTSHFMSYVSPHFSLSSPSIASPLRLPKMP